VHTNDFREGMSRPGIGHDTPTTTPHSDRTRRGDLSRAPTTPWRHVVVSCHTGCSSAAVNAGVRRVQVERPTAPAAAEAEEAAE